MLTEPANLLRIPHFLSASTPQALQKLMLEANAQDMCEYRYTSIQFVGGKWYAWYLKDVSNQSAPIILAKKKLKEGQV